MNCKCKGTGRRDGFSEYLDCMEPGCNVATERAEFNKRLKEAGSMSVEDAAWWGRQDALAELGDSCHSFEPTLKLSFDEYWHIARKHARTQELHARKAWEFAISKYGGKK